MGTGVSGSCQQRGREASTPHHSELPSEKPTVVSMAPGQITFARSGTCLRGWKQGACGSVAGVGRMESLNKG